MKIGIMSDMHLEFGGYSEDIPAVDVMILAGDIATAKMLLGIDPDRAPADIAPDKELYTWEFFNNIKKQAQHIIYIAGNHEYYGCEYHKANTIIKEFCDLWDIHFLNRDTVTIQGVPFKGATLWTDPGDDKYLVEQRMSDYHRTKIKDGNNYRKLQVRDTVAIHNKDKKFIFDGALDDAVIVTHHLPAKACVHPKYRGDRLNGGFMTDLTEDIKAHRPRLWIHGHTHEQVDTEIGLTRIICNPRGYIGHEHQAEGYKCKVIELNE